MKQRVFGTVAAFLAAVLLLTVPCSANSARSAVVLDCVSGRLLLDKKGSEKSLIASTTKIMTALLVCERCNVLDQMVIPKQAVGIEGSSMYLKEGERLTLQELLYGLMLLSGNDAAVALAEYVAGTRATFVDMMNQRVKQMGCTNTTFTDVHGAGSGAQYTTARDMIRIMLTCSDNETVKTLLSTQEYTVEATNLSEKRSLQSQDYLMQNKIVTKYIDDRVTSGFVSYSNDAGASIVCTADNTKTAGATGMNLVCVVLGATRVFAENGWQVTNYGNFDEMVKLLSWAYKNFKVHRVIYNGMSLEQIPVAGGNNDVVGVANVDIDTVLPSAAKMANLIRNVSVRDGGLTAPIQKDDVIGTVEIWYSNSCLMEAQLLAQESVRTAADSGLTVYSALAPQNQGEKNSLSGAILIICAVILVPTVSYLAINSYLRSRAKAKRRKRRENRRRSQ